MTLRATLQLDTAVKRVGKLFLSGSYHVERYAHFDYIKCIG